MEPRNIQRIACEAVFAYFSDEALESVDSSPDLTTYRYLCGCVVLRFVEGDECEIRWCPRDAPAPTLRRGRRGGLHVA